ncbi:hypothetical protein L2E82_49774 [Cichorium intybus]|uniref:Uncharacterized protein n=1 Tax=Cichorium intybus TaxID=13427 RepID=A0ACB8Z102_CICIN|nr:hypothetical protein L2E82_49774 [Cichorium intybus]
MKASSVKNAEKGTRAVVAAILGHLAAEIVEKRVILHGTVGRTIAYSERPRDDQVGRKEESKSRGRPVASRAFQMTVEEAREKTDVVTGPFSL